MYSTLVTYVFLFLVSSTSTLSKNQAAPTNPELSCRIRHFVKLPSSTAFIVKMSSLNIPIKNQILVQNVTSCVSHYLKPFLSCKCKTEYLVSNKLQILFSNTLFKRPFIIHRLCLDTNFDKSYHNGITFPDSNLLMLVLLVLSCLSPESTGLFL